MNYGKKVLVLSQVADGFSALGKRISAILRIESEGGVSTLYLSAINFAAKAEGNFFLFIMDGNKKLYSFPLGKRPFSLTREVDFPKDILSGFAAGISYILNEIPVLVAYSSCENFLSDKSEFKKAIAAKCISELKKTAAQNELFMPETVAIPPENYAHLKEYDDEAVATENYYLLDEDMSEKLKLIENIENVRNANTVRDSKSEEETEKSGENDCGNQSENSDSNVFTEEKPYIESARAELENIFFKFPEETLLSKVIPESRWAKINYSPDKYYVVGIVKENGKEKYVCYGVPAKYSTKPPKELKGFCSFVPLSYFDMKGDGFWMMFQSAITGECVKPKE